MSVLYVGLEQVHGRTMENHGFLGYMSSSLGPIICDHTIARYLAIVLFDHPLQV